MPTSPIWIRKGAFLLAIVLTLACVLPGGVFGPSAEEATAEALSTGIESTRLAGGQTSTAGANATSTQRAQPTTPAPTVTPLPSVTPDSAATAAVEATLAPIRGYLSGYGIDPGQGRLGWAHAPVTIELQSYGAQDYATDFPNIVTRNFVVQADVTWETRTGLAGCGFIFRADQEQNFYGMGIARGATGVSVFDRFLEGRSVRGSFEVADAPTTNWRNGETNRLAIVAQENAFSLFVNGQFTHQRVDNSLQAGIVAFAALSESGLSICTFNNGWLWILD
jgi:hypothetical protein